MTVYYLRSTDGSDASDGLTWANAKATLVGAFTVAAAGDTIYVSQSHAETTSGNVILNCVGTAAAPIKVICANDAAEPPTAVATTATVQANGILDWQGSAYYYGIGFVTAGGISAIAMRFAHANSWWCRLEDCTINMTGTYNLNYMRFGATSSPNAQKLELINTSLGFQEATNLFYITCELEWKDSVALIANTVAPTEFIATEVLVDRPRVLIDGVDLSAVNTTLINTSFDTRGDFEFRNCKLHANAVRVASDQVNPGGVEVRFVNCSSGDVHYDFYKDTYQGVETHEATIVRTGGASDGTTTISRKMVSGANVSYANPMVSDPIVVFNNTSGTSLTATLEAITDNTTLTDAEAWLEVEYPATSGTPLATFIDDKAATILTTPANQATSSATWTTTGLGAPITQNFSVTFTPAEKGPLYARVYLAKASTTMYYDPMLTIA